MKHIPGVLAMLLVPGVLAAQGGTGGAATRPNVPVTTNGTMGTGRRTLEPPVINKGEPARADARASDEQSRAQSGTGTVTTHPGTPSTTRPAKRKHRRVKRKTTR